MVCSVGQIPCPALGSSTCDAIFFLGQRDHLIAADAKGRECPSREIEQLRIRSIGQEPHDLIANLRGPPLEMTSSS